MRQRIPMLLVAVLIGGILGSTSTATGTPITLVPNTTNMFRDTRGVNTVGVAPGNQVQYGADIQGGSSGTTIGALNGAFVDPAVPCGPLAVNPNFCAGTFGFNPNLLSGYTIQFKNGPDIQNVTAPSLVGAENPVPFPVSVTITTGATPTTPTISWAIPSNITPDAFRVNIFDVSGPNLPNGTKNVIHSAAIPAGSTSYAIPASVGLVTNHNYAINFQVIDLRAGVTEAQFVQSNSNALILNRSNSYFNFNPQTGGPPNVHLPQVEPDQNPNDQFGPVYRFNIEKVGPTSVTFIDPQVAVGYDYAIGAGNPNFASVLLPNVGDGIYDVIFNGLHNAVLAGQQFFFPQGGVDEFGVRGIEASAGLDPLNVNAFITGLTFVTEGSFTGTMIPIVQFVPAPVPEPGTLGLLLIGGLAMGLRGKVVRRSVVNAGASSSDPDRPEPA